MYIFFLQKCFHVSSFGDIDPLFLKGYQSDVGYQKRALNRCCGPSWKFGKEGRGGLEQKV